MINFNVPPCIGLEQTYINEVILKERKLSGDGLFTKRCHQLIEAKFSTKKALLTTSCTHALEMAALLIDIHPGDEVIMPSYTFVSTANAFALRGAKIVFVDIRPDTMNIDEKLIEQAISPRTRAIIPVHYAGVACEMNSIMDIAKRHQLIVVEDAAQGVMATYQGKALGAIGDFGCYSFHETKNYTMGEGGALLIQNTEYVERAEIIREKGTNRSKYFRGEVDKYSWVDIGSSYLPSEINAAYLLAQLENAEMINNDRLSIWSIYNDSLIELSKRGYFEMPQIPEGCKHNAHMFYIKCKDIDERTKLIQHLKSKGIMAIFHYIPLHTAPNAEHYSRFDGTDQFTTRESERLLRLPLYYGLKQDEVLYITEQIKAFYI